MSKPRNVKAIRCQKARDVWKFECLKVWMFESLGVSKIERLKVWMPESLNVSKSSFSKLEPLELEFEGCLARKLRFQSLKSWNLKDVSHQSFVRTLEIWRMSRTKASSSKLEHLEFEGKLARNAFLPDSGCTKSSILQDKTCLRYSQMMWGSLSGGRFGNHSVLPGSFSNRPRCGTAGLGVTFQLAKFEGCLARKLRFQSLSSWNLKDVLHESFVLKAWTVGIWRMSRTKALSSELEHLEFEGKPARNACEIVDARNRLFCRTKRVLGWSVGKLVRRTVSEHALFYRDHSRIGPAVNCQFRRHFHSFNFQKMKDVSHKSFVKLRFQSLNTWNLKNVSHESFVVKAWTVRIWRMPRTTASVAKLEQLVFEGCLARKLRCQSLNTWNLKDASHDSFGCKAWTVGIWRMSRTKASFPNLEQLEFEECLARRLRFQSLNDWILKGVSHESFVFKAWTLGIWMNLKDVSHESFVCKAWTVGIWRMSRTKASFPNLEQLEFEECLARRLRFQSLNDWILKGVSHESFVFKAWTLGIWMNLKDVSHESFVCKAWTVGIWRMSRTKASFPNLEQLEFEECLARRLRFQSLNDWILKGVSHESFVFKAWTLGIWMNLKDVSHESFVCKAWALGIWRMSRTKALSSELEHLEFEGKPARNACEIVDARNRLFCRTKRVLGWSVGKLVRWTVSEHARFYQDHGWIGPAVQLPVHAPFCQHVCAWFFCDLQLSLSRSQWNWLLRRRFGDILARSPIALCNSVSADRTGTDSSWVLLPTFLRVVAIVFCNSVCADRNVMATSRLLGAAAAYVIVLSFAAGHCESYWNGCIKAAVMICTRFS